MTELSEQPFERHPALASWIERLGNTPGLMSLGDWTVFIGALNQALNAARAEGAEPPPSYDGSRSLGERFHEAFLEAWGHMRLVAYADFPAPAQAAWERAALNFTARLSDAKEDNRASRSQPVSGAVGQDSDTGKVSG